MFSSVPLLAGSLLATTLMILGAHALRIRFGLALFYALMGGMTSIAAWIIDVGSAIHVGELTFNVGSSVFYTALLLGVFVVYVFDGPRAARAAILTVVGLSILGAAMKFILYALASSEGAAFSRVIPLPSLRNNAASVITGLANLLFLAVSWESIGRSRFGTRLWLRIFFTLVGVMSLDVVVFTTGAFFGNPAYFSIMAGTLTSRLIVCLFAFPLLYVYMMWQRGKNGGTIESRPILSILKQMIDIRVELDAARQEIARRKQAESEKEAAIKKLEDALIRVHRLEGVLPVCAACKRIRVESESSAMKPRWISLEDYLHTETPVRFSHGICPECAKSLYPNL